MIKYIISLIDNGMTTVLCPVNLITLSKLKFVSFTYIWPFIILFLL